MTNMEHEFIIVFDNGEKRNITKNHMELINNSITNLVELEEGEWYVNKDHILYIMPVEFDR